MRRSNTTDPAKLIQKSQKVATQVAKLRRKRIKSGSLEKQARLRFRSLDNPMAKIKGFEEGYSETVAGKTYPIGFVTGKLAGDINNTNMLLWDENARYSELMDVLEGDGDGSTKKGKLATQSEIFAMMASRPDVKKLAQAMKINQGTCLGEPPIGVPGANGKIEIIEGNERIVASILNHMEDPETFATIPIKIYKGLDRARALLVLAQLHGNAKSPWGGKEKARLHWNAIKDSGLEIGQYALFQRMNPTRLKILMASYLANQQYEEMYNGTKPKLFTYFTKLFSRAGFRVRMGMQSAAEGKGRRKKGEEFDPLKGMSSDFLREFMKWLALSKLTDCTQVDSLEVVLDHPVAGKMFREDDACKFVAAWNVYAQDRPEHDSPVYATINELALRLDELPESELGDLKKNRSAKSILWQKLRTSMARIEEKMGVKS